MGWDENISLFGSGKKKELVINTIDIIKIIIFLIDKIKSL